MPFRRAGTIALARSFSRLRGVRRALDSDLHRARCRIFYKRRPERSAEEAEGATGGGCFLCDFGLLFSRDRESEGRLNLHHPRRLHRAGRQGRFFLVARHVCARRKERGKGAREEVRRTEATISVRRKEATFCVSGKTISRIPIRATMGDDGLRWAEMAAMRRYPKRVETCRCNAT